MQFTVIGFINSIWQDRENDELDKDQAQDGATDTGTEKVAKLSI